MNKLEDIELARNVLTQNDNLPEFRFDKSETYIVFRAHKQRREAIDRVAKIMIYANELLEPINKEKKPIYFKDNTEYALKQLDPILKVTNPEKLKSRKERWKKREHELFSKPFLTLDNMARFMSNQKASWMTIEMLDCLDTICHFIQECDSAQQWASVIFKKEQHND